MEIRNISRVIVTTDVFDNENVKTIVKPTKRQTTWQFETMSLIKLLLCMVADPLIPPCSWDAMLGAIHFAEKNGEINM